MKIEVTENVFWDDELEVQSEEYNQWFSEEAIPLLAQATPEIDSFMRPFIWVADFSSFVVTMEREYVDQSTSWAMKTETIILTNK